MRLARLRAAAGLQQRDVAYCIGVPQSRISGWERRAPNLQDRQVEHLAELFGVKPSTLKGGTVAGAVNQS